MMLHETTRKATKLYSASGMAKLVRRLRVLAKRPPTFALDACRHGGMTELEEAELTDGHGRVHSAHKSRADESYAKRTMERERLLPRASVTPTGWLAPRTIRDQNSDWRAERVSE
jgi:hypothetical protein